MGKGILTVFIIDMGIYRPECFCQFRVIQEEYDKIRIQLAIEADADKSTVEKSVLAGLHQEVRKNGVEYIIDFLDKIPPDPNGKIRLLISKVK